MLEKTIWIIIKYFRGIIIYNKDTISSNINKYMETRDEFDNNSFSSSCFCEKKVSMNITYLFKSNGKYIYCFSKIGSWTQKYTIETTKDFRDLNIKIKKVEKKLNLIFD